MEKLIFFQDDIFDDMTTPTITTDASSACSGCLPSEIIAAISVPIPIITSCISVAIYCCVVKKRNARNKAARSKNVGTSPQEGLEMTGNIYTVCQ